MEVDVQCRYNTSGQKECVFSFSPFLVDAEGQDAELLIVRDKSSYKYLTLSGCWSDEEVWIKPVSVEKENESFKLCFLADFFDIFTESSHVILSISLRINGKEYKAYYPNTSQGDPVEEGEGGNSIHKYVVYAIAVLLLVVPSVFFLRHYFTPDGEQVEVVSGIDRLLNHDKLLTEREIAQWVIRKNPTPEDAFWAAREYFKASKIEAAFLVYRNSARQGHAGASIELGKMYDPVLFGTVPTVFSKPNPEKAAEWYIRAKDFAPLSDAWHREASELLNQLTHHTP